MNIKNGLLSIKRILFNKPYSIENLLIDHNKKFIFIHIPKTGGTSIARALNIVPKGHITTNQVKKIIHNDIYESYFKFCFVRNPIDRFISLYKYARMLESYHHSNSKSMNGTRMKSRHEDYELLKNSNINDCVNHLINNRLKHDWRYNLWQPQINWIKNDKEGLDVDFIGKYENIEDDFNIILHRLNLPKINLPQLNLSKKENIKHDLNKDMKKELLNFYRVDYEKFNY